MTIGEKITALRTSHDMSQGDLAEKLNVSRQSISKWETNTSIPELDKLIQLSDLFGISLDELARDKELPQNDNDPWEKPPLPPEPTPQPRIGTQSSVSTQRIVGFILLAVGLLCCILALVFGSGLAVIGGYIVLCSIFCLLLRKHAALVIGWVSFFLFAALSPYFTSVSLFAVFHPYFYESDRSLSIPRILTAALWILLAVLVFFSCRAYRKYVSTR